MQGRLETELKLEKATNDRVVYAGEKKINLYLAL